MSIDTINKRLKILSDLQEEMNKARNVFDDTLENDPAYQEFQEEIKKVKEESSVKKDKILTSPTVRDLQEQMKKIREDIKENKEILAQELADYYKESGSLQITDEEGNTKRIIFSVKLVNS
ncbi:hypothetical protein C4561_04550 [candidate division WWE3 bacterium]|jgi:uncharacterized membrane-anchored protein YjiN (DUF445 family)|uniref:PCRF domain-containing protein n=1 Tax=candidate division WWE3 bacterium TaxID=2053526 RepID=A0A3A4ZJJ2_UNCKA|nr:MAG: hypothetical protein C4561_04550 [candidate division WWE3 bacterium]